MKAALALLWALTVVAAFGLARLTGPPRERSDLEAVDSFRQALADPDPLTRSYRMSAFLQGLDPDGLPAALEALETNNVGVTREEVRLFMLAWSRFDAPGAFAWSRAWPTQWKDTLMAEAMYAWGFRNAPAALREVDAVDDPQLQARLRSSLFEGWLQSPDRAGASEYIAAISDPRRRRRLAFLLAAETMRDGPEAVMRWAEDVPEDAPNDFKQGAFYLAATLVAREDPRRAAEWFEAHRARPYSAGSLEGIALRWAEHHDPPALFDWLRSLSSEGERGSEPADAVAAGFRIWLGKSPEQAEAWLSSRLPDPALDPAIAELARARAQSSPASALEWAARIQDEARRRRSVVRAGRTWRRQDPEAARAWLERSDLPEEVRQSITGESAAAARRPAAALSDERAGAAAGASRRGDPPASQGQR
jgi:hypothetical protein